MDAVRFHRFFGLAGEVQTPFQLHSFFMPIMLREHFQSGPVFGLFRIVGVPGKRVTNRPSRECRRSIIRRAVAAVEAAVALPLLVLLVFGSIEVANSIFLAQTLSSASYEGVREAARPGATAAQVNHRVAQIMQARGIHAYNVTITPASITSTERGAMVTVRVEAAMSALSTHVTSLTNDKTSHKEACMVKH